MTDWGAAAEKVAEQIQGTCESLDGVCERMGFEGAFNVQEFCNRLDMLVFECTACGWWCEISEMSEDEAHDWQCSDCARG